jgi:hypothetical protein
LIWWTRTPWWRHAGRLVTGIATLVVLATCLLLLATPTSAGMYVREIAADELNHIQQQFPLPPFTLALIDRYGTQGNTVVAAAPTRYAIVLWDHYWREDQLRKTTAHEAAHVLLAHHGLPQSEAQADLFAACFGSSKARAFAATMGISGDCNALADLIGQAMGAPEP